MHAYRLGAAAAEACSEVLADTRLEPPFVEPYYDMISYAIISYNVVCYDKSHSMIQ